MNGAELIAAERERQIAVEGWTPEHDAEHANGEMRRASKCYLSTTDAAQVGVPNPYSPLIRDYGGMRWPWSEAWWKPSDDPLRNLVKAGALIAAEIDRLAAQEQTGEQK